MPTFSAASAPGPSPIMGRAFLNHGGHTILHTRPRSSGRSAIMEFRQEALARRDLNWSVTKAIPRCQFCMQDGRIGYLQPLNLHHRPPVARALEQNFVGHQGVTGYLKGPLSSTSCIYVYFSHLFAALGGSGRYAPPSLGYGEPNNHDPISTN